MKKTIIYLVAGVALTLIRSLGLAQGSSMVKPTQEQFFDILNDIAASIKDEGWAGRLLSISEELDDLLSEDGEEGLHLPDLLPTMTEELGCTINCLYSLVPLTEQVLYESRPFRSTAVGLLAYTINIQDKFPQIPTALAQTLGQNNWTRHLALRADLKSVQQRRRAILIRDAVSKGESRNTVSSDTGSAYQITQKTAPATNQPDRAASRKIFVSSSLPDYAGRARLPPLPIEICNLKGHAGPARFTCNLCDEDLALRKDNVMEDWKKHLLKDLKPYSCISPSCREPGKTYESREDWITHEFDCYRQQGSIKWICRLCTGAPEFTDSDALREHSNARHRQALGELFPSGSNRGTVQPDRQYAPAYTKTLCPFCGIILQQCKVDVASHIGPHLEGIALKALPECLDYDEGTANGEDSSSCSQTRYDHMLCRNSAVMDHDGF
ncbi:hypothetical protein BJ508DRAFT_53439 [Ascobolus immersus RN42]|uniref:C2H2-type domain-containing protein n=1 Tax=Ascobolus immersus RN42 TaxID=1160509 RepID=A0A3N4HLA0_ASCIM|nr:hypothetical protein BJ508DRAFT_53439 [Ascobolus immersus RN42]